MQDLKEVTDNIHYENYRRKRLTEEKHEQIVLQNNVVNMDDVICQESKIWMKNNNRTNSVLDSASRPFQTKCTQEIFTIETRCLLFNILTI